MHAQPIHASLARSPAPRAPPRNETDPARQLRGTRTLSSIYRNQSATAPCSALGHQPQTAHRATLIQRHVAPGTVALGQSLTACLLGHFADLSLQNMELQQTASEVGFTADGLLSDSTDFIVYSVSAEAYDTDSTTQVTPATATTPTTVDVREPLVITGSDT